MAQGIFCFFGKLRGKVVPLIGLFSENRPHVTIPGAVITGEEAVRRCEAGLGDIIEFGEVAGLVIT
tara:strand:- start:1 stop:198 length:198 start_codon:yes stop_codon:yes gene_type:complete